MPVFKKLVDLQVLKGLRGFLGLEAGLVRGVAGKKGQAEHSKDQEISRLQQQLAETSEELAGLKAAKTSDASPEEIPMFFIVAPPKSGTTWLRQMLDQHPEVLCHGEGRFFGRNDRNDTFEQVKTNRMGHKMRPGSLHNVLAENEYLRFWIERTWWSKDGDVEEHIANLTREAVRYFLAQKLSGTNKKIVGDKTPIPNAEIVREIGGMLPEAKILHIIRDGRDQAISHTHHRWNRVRPVEEGGKLKPEDGDKRDRYREDPEGFLASGESIFTEERIVSAAKGWSSNVRHSRRDGPSQFGDRYEEVRYEDLLERPEEEMARLFRFLGASDNENLVRRCVNRNRFENRSKRQSGDEDSSAFLRKGVAGDWRNVFNERDREIFKEYAGDLLIELGYEKDNNW